METRPRLQVPAAVAAACCGLLLFACVRSPAPTSAPPSVVGVWVPSGALNHVGLHTPDPVSVRFDDGGNLTVVHTAAGPVSGNTTDTGSWHYGSDSELTVESESRAPARTRTMSGRYRVSRDHSALALTFISGDAWLAGSYNPTVTLQRTSSD